MTRAAKGAWGNAGRNIVRGPGLWELDLAIKKRTPVSEHASLSFRAEAFSLFNHAMYGIR